MKINWRKSTVTGNYCNTKSSAVVIKPCCGILFEVVAGVSTLDVTTSLYKAKVRANNFIRTMQSQSELCAAEYRRLLK